MNKIFCIGDIHGAFKALIDVLKKSNFNYNEDKLICLGDVADGFPDVIECFDELMKIKNLIYIMGNHDEWLLDWLRYGTTEYIWVSQGGQATIESFAKHHKTLGESTDKYVNFLNKARYYYVDDKNRVFVHGGFHKDKSVEEESKSVLTWDRDLISIARSYHKTSDRKKITKYDEIFIGHTTTKHYGNTTEPINYCNLWDLDTGAGWSGKLTIMDVDTKEYFQSDFVKNYYPECKGRF